MTIVWDDETVTNNIIWDDPVVAPAPNIPPAVVKTKEKIIPKEQGIFGRSKDRLTLGVSDAMSTMAGDTYGRSGDPTQIDSMLPEERILKVVGGDIIPAVADVSMDALITAGKEVLTQEEEDAIAANLSDLTQSKPAQLLGTGLEKTKEFLGPRGSAVAGELFNVGSAVLPVPKIKPKFGINSRAKLEKSIANQKRIETERLLQPDNLEGPGKVIEKENFMQNRDYIPSEREAKIAKSVSEIPEINPRKSNNYNTNVIEKELAKLDADLINLLDASNNPAVSVVTVENAIDDAIDIARQTPNLVGTAGEKAEALSKHIDSLLKKYKDVDGDITPNNILRIRRDLDQWTKKYSPKDLYGDSASALSDANDAIRKALNETLAQSAPNVAVRDRLFHMSDLYTAKSTIYPRGLPNREAGNRLSRYVDSLERSLGVSHPTTPLGLQRSINPFIGAGTALAAGALGIKRGGAAALRRNRTSLAEMTADAIRQGSAGLQRAAIIDLANDEEEY